jgi:RNA polymerase sigma-70 factor, ECF subfamily
VRGVWDVGKGWRGMEYERFAALVIPHTPAMARVAAALLGAVEAEDAAQEALVRAWRGWPALREPDAVRTWLLRITVNVCRNWQVGQFGTSRRATESLDTAAELLSAKGTGLGTFEHADVLDMRRALTRLSDDLRQVIALRFFVGLDATEIGELLDAPPATIRTRLRRALALLREAMRRDEPGEVAPLPGTHDGGGSRR